MGMAPMGIGGSVVLLILILIFGRDFIGGSDGGQPTTGTSNGEVAPPASETPAEKKEVQFMSWVLDTTQATWAKIMPEQLGGQYHDAKLVLFRDATQTGCGVGQAGMGPFYCPNDEKVYVDLAFYDELASRFGAPGEFAQAYVLAHELGHHVQHILGTDRKIRQLQQSNPGEANQASVALELQADCLAGVWGHFAQQGGALDANEADQGLQAAAAVGDDRIQQQTRGRVNQETFTHGSSAQRASWFKRGFNSGDAKSCNTFQ